MPGIAAVESWNGTSWTEVGDINTGRKSGGASGTTTAGVIFGGLLGDNNGTGNTEAWNGSSWTEVNNLSTTGSAGAGANASPYDTTLYFGRSPAANETEEFSSVFTIDDA